jgi:uncharacterized protein (DUF2164 family)
MSIKLTKDSEKYLLKSIKRFFEENMDSEIGDLKAARVLEFCVREIGPSIYNQAIADAQAYLHKKADDLSGSSYEPEFDYWKK